MRVRVTLKSLGSKRCKLSSEPFELACRPQTVGELMAAAVRSCVAGYNARFEQSGTTPLTEEDIEHRRALGKIAFGFNYGTKPADGPQAIAHALQAYEDGLFRVFINGNECGGLADSVSLNEDDCLTFIRLTMLTGGICS